MEASRKMPLLGGEMEVILYDIDTETASRYLHEIYAEGLRLQRIFNFFDEKSELSKLNITRNHLPSKELMEVISKAMQFCEMTKGEYDISKGKQFLDRKMKNRVMPVSCTYKDIKINNGTIALKHPDVLVDLGSIAKGYIVDRIISYAMDFGIESAFVNARGDMRICGKHLEVIEVQHPRDNESALFSLVFENLAIATSGDYMQYDGDPGKCHILNKKDIISATVVSDSLMEADAAATSIFAMGVKKSEEFLSKNQNLKCMIVDSKMMTYFFNGFEELML